MEGTMKALSIAAIVAALYASPVVAAEGNKQLGKVQFETFCKLADPKCAFVAVRYRDYWYYIDDRDQTSKSTFALVTQLNRLDFGRDAPGAPFLTLPVGRIN
jgi:hypothetical protein